MEQLKTSMGVRVCDKEVAQGYVTLLSVLIVGAIALSVSVSLLLFGVNASRGSLSLTRQYQAKALAQTCSEAALQVIHDNTGFTGTASVSLGTGTCTYTVISTGGSTRAIEATGTSQGSTRKVKVEVSGLTPSITISSWRDVADF